MSTLTHPQTTNAIGLDVEKSQKLATGLNDLLANYQIFYLNVRGFHWNIKGDKFFELHMKFEELYTDLFERIDEVAERVITLGGVPLHTYPQYVERSEVKQVANVSDGSLAIRNILDAFKVLLVKQRQLLELSDEADDEGTNSLMSDYITQQEKTVWMYSSYLGK